MPKKSFITPTPQKSRKEKGMFEIKGKLSIILTGGKNSKKANLAANYLIARLNEYDIKTQIRVKKDSGGKKAVVLSTLDNFSEQKLGEKTRKTFRSRYRGKQGYYLSSLDKNRVYIAGTGEQGILYGVMSLVQLLDTDKSGCLSIPRMEISDWPDFEYRCAVNCLLHGETSRWGYDWGDGINEFVERIKKKLEFCLKYKINMVQFEGFNWNYRKFPGYAARMRELNRYARERGISLVFGGYGIGLGGRGRKTGLIGIDFVRGLGDKNRLSYPGGKTYRCCGDPRNEKTRFNGTCRSNEKLNGLKKMMLARYVKTIEPGALYIHHEDLARYDKVQKWWDRRCEKCRQKWPSDKLEAFDGAAGAVAEGYRWLCEAVWNVNNRKSGYDGKNDCRIILISPLYTHDAEDDAVWDREMEFWKNVSRRMQPSENVYFGLREQFLREDTGEKRIAQLSKTLGKTGKGHRLYIFAVGGADLYTNDLLFTSTPALNHLFEKAGIIFNFSGHLNQEPQQVLNAEYQWNVNSPWYAEKTSSCKESREQWEKHTSRRLMPERIYGDKGFMGEICRKIYGRKAGGYMAQIYRLGKTQHESPLSILDYPSPYTRQPVSSVSLKKKDSFSSNVTYWRKKLDSTIKAQELIELALASSDLKEEQKQTAEWFSRCLNTGEKFAEIFLAFYTAANEKSPAVKADMLEELKKKTKQMERYLRSNFSFNITSPGNSDLEIWLETLRSLKKTHL